MSLHPAVPTNLCSEELHQQITALLEQGKQGQRVATWDKIKSLLVKEGLARTNVRMPPELVGVHPENRSKIGLQPSMVHQHGHEILQAGFSWSKCQDATAVEVPPSPLDKAAKDLNTKVVEMSKGLLPVLPDIKLLSLGSGHTNAFLRALKADCTTDCEALKGQDGRLSSEVLTLKKPELADAMRDGLAWCVLHWALPYVFPSLVDLIQSALNIVARSPKSELEVMMDMHNLAKGCDDEPDWKGIQAIVGQTLPPCSHYLNHVSAYVARNSGGKSGQLLLELNNFCQLFLKADKQRALGAEFLGKLTHLQYGKGQHFPYVENAVVEANLCCHNSRVVDGICRLIPASSLALLAKHDNRGALVEAENLLMDARALVGGLELNSAHKATAIGMLDCRVALHLVKKTKEAEGKTYKNLTEIQQVQTMGQ
eukprot:6482083-Amphidinium_carterae.1